MSDLIVIGYPDEDTAEKVWNELVKLQADYLVDLEDAAIIRRDQRENFTSPPRRTTPWPGDLSAGCSEDHHRPAVLFPLFPLTAAAGGVMGAALGAARDLGIKDEFEQRVQDLVQPGTSAILVIVRKVTPDKFLDALRPYGGTVLQTSLTSDAEQGLMKALHGDDQAAATSISESARARPGQQWR